MSLKLIDRLIFGCGRLAGGVSARASEDLLRRAFDLGFSAVDVAPSYGLGLAEQVVGQAVRDYPSVRVTTKVGMPVPKYGWAKSVARAVKRTIGPAAPRSFDDFVPIEPPERYRSSYFAFEELRLSVARSQEALGRIDTLMLHNCGPAEATPDLLGAFEAIAAEHDAAPGYGNQGYWDRVTDAAFPESYISQVAVEPSWLAGRRPAATRASIELHSLLPTAEYLARIDPAFASKWQEASAAIPGSPSAARIAAILALVAVRVLGSRLVISSTHEDRMTELLEAVHHFDGDGALQDIAQIFDADPTR